MAYELALIKMEVVLRDFLLKIRLFVFGLLSFLLVGYNSLYSGIDYTTIDQSLLEGLPFVDGQDEESALYASPYLPNNPVILEAGTSGGEDTCNFKRIWKDATIYGFEPVSASYERTLESTKGLNGVTIFPYALSNTVGEVTFFVSQNNSGCSSLFPDNFSSVVWPFEGDSTQEDFSNNHYRDVPVTVFATTVNKWGKENNVSHIDYIWLDTEGAELQILSAATDFLCDVRVISAEVNFQEFRAGMTQFSQLYEFLIKQNFSLKYIWANPKWQGVAMFVNNRFLDMPLNLTNSYLVPGPVKP